MQIQHVLFDTTSAAMIVLGQDQQCLLASLVMCVCDPCTLLDQPLICIHSHERSSGKSFQHNTVRSTVLVFAASPLKMGSSTLPTRPRMVMHLREVLLRQSSKLPVASSSTYMGRWKDIASSVTQEVFQKHTNDEACSSQCTCPTSHHAHIKSSPHSAMYEGSHMYATDPLELLHGATLSRECCHDNLYRCLTDLHFSQPVLSSQELTQNCMV